MYLGHWPVVGTGSVVTTGIVGVACGVGGVGFVMLWDVGGVVEASDVVGVVEPTNVVGIVKSSSSSMPGPKHRSLSS
jgi:hypothetical protein